MKKKYRRIINDLQSITQKTKDRATRISLKTGGEPSTQKTKDRATRISLKDSSTESLERDGQQIQQYHYSAGFDSTTECIYTDPVMLSVSGE
jgi:hypothetical protein